MEATLPLHRRRCSSPLSTVLSVSSASSSLARCFSESALHCDAPPSTPVVRRPSRADGSRPVPSSTPAASTARRPSSGIVRSRSASSASSASPRSSVQSRVASEQPEEEYRGAPRPALIVKMNACTLLRQQELAQRREAERRELQERAWAERRRQLARAQLSDRLEMVQRREAPDQSRPSARERLRALRLNTREREVEYQREKQSMEARVRAMPLLLERQVVVGVTLGVFYPFISFAFVALRSAAAARRRLEQQYERKLKEMGFSWQWLQDKASGDSPRQNASSQRDPRMPQRIRSAVARCPAVRTPPSASPVMVRRRLSRSASLSSLASAAVISRTESASDLSAAVHDEHDPGAVDTSGVGRETPPTSGDEDYGGARVLQLA
ncbi:hypothetical protein HPB48_019141 [Haemaphysalis longicornis]|uniref:Transmembrane protein n=1 Tax=Haemaphysalis longicornis TaxID=44386 RepID=A0A9J6GMM4_HAELO|nr:hypothetical protein HPB48_019141 [Haemaphysalis longicornis]